MSTVPYPYCYQRYRIRSRWLERDRVDTALNYKRRLIQALDSCSPTSANLSRFLSLLSNAVKFTSQGGGVRLEALKGLTTQC